MKINDLAAAAAAAVIFIILAFVLQWEIPVALILSVALYFALSLLLKPRRKIGGIDVERLKNGAELEAEFDNAHGDLNVIEKAAQTANDEAIRAGAGKLEATGSAIIAYLEKNPAMVSNARRFLDYYLDTGVAILNKYMDLCKNNAPEAELSKITEQTRQAVDVLNKAFELQYTKLLEGEVMDIEGDIELLKKTLKMEELS